MIAFSFEKAFAPELISVSRANTWNRIERDFWSLYAAISLVTAGPFKRRKPGLPGKLLPDP